MSTDSPLARLLEAASDHESEVITRLMLKSGLLWECEAYECGGYNNEAAHLCEECGKLKPGTAGGLAGEAVTDGTDDSGIPPLHKTTVVIWSPYRGDSLGLSELARQAEGGDAYCSGYHSVTVAEPGKDPDWDGTEFFTDCCPDADASASEENDEHDP